MPIDYEAIARAGGIGKGPPAAVQRDVRRTARESVDEQESQKVNRSCCHCGKAFQANRQDVARGWGKFCSKSCQSLSRRAVIQEKTCERCGGQMAKRGSERPHEWSERRFCRSECSKAHARAKWERHRNARAKPCAQCGTVFVKSWNQNRDTFCSERCYRLNAADKKVARRAALKCRICGGPAPGLRFSYGGTCSVKCGHALRSQNAKTRKPANCEVCHKAFIAITGRWRRWRWARFCSDKCRRVVLSRRPQFLDATCAQCGTQFKRTAAALKRVKLWFCDKTCQHMYLAGERHPMFRGDKDPNRGAAWNRLAESIRQRDGYKCRRCEKPQGREKLSVDHVRPWRSFTDKALANHPDNLASLCRTCHSYKTTTVERAWLKGDVIAWKKWIASLHLPSAKFGWVA